MWLKLFCYVDSFWNSSLKNSSSNPKSNLANSSSNLLYLSCKPKLIETRVWQTWVLEKVYITKKICPCAIHMKFSFKSTIQPFAVLFTIIQSSQREKKKKEKKKDKKKKRKRKRKRSGDTSQLHFGYTLFPLFHPSRDRCWFSGSLMLCFLCQFTLSLYCCLCSRSLMLLSSMPICNFYEKC